MKTAIKVPSVGESINFAEIEGWEKSTGDYVKKGEVLVVLETDKASMEVVADRDGILHILKLKSSQVKVGEVIGFIDASKVSDIVPSDTVINKDKGRQNESLSMEKKSYPLAPSVRRILGENKLSPAGFKGTGKDGRLTKKDILRNIDNSSFVDSNNMIKETNMKPESSNTKNKNFVSAVESIKTPLRKGQVRTPMTSLRKKTAKKLVFSQKSTATLSTFNEVDLSNVIAIRKSCQEQFVKKWGIKLGFMSFFIKSVVLALKAYPRINAFIDDTDIIYNQHQHIGVAVSTQKGLVVPVLFFAETLSFAEIEKKILEYKQKALSKTLSVDEILGGTFTISNGGVFGSLLSTPILNPPQSGILGMHVIQERPVAVNGKMEIRPMMYVTLSYDHRIVDGRESVGFLMKVKENLQEPSRLMLDV